MCGIVGIISKNNINIDDLRVMNNSIKHRGPDSFGEYVEDNVGLAMRRLKIIDLAGGDQPIFNEDKKIVVFFNGEIYNYKDVRKLLIEKKHQFRTNSDTEVLAHGYEEWGMDGLLERIEGMFAFTIYDKNKSIVFIARDRFGEKPLYYFNDGINFYFASELRSLLSQKNIPKEIDPYSLYTYLTLHFVPGEKIILKDIFRINSGNYLEIDANNLSVKTNNYWKIEESENKDSFEIAIKKVKKLFEESVKLRMIADVPVGAFLSGGIDSSIMVGIMSRYNAKLNTFSIGFKNGRFDESEFSKEVSNYFKTTHHHFVFTEKEALENLHQVINFMDEPIGDQALLPVYLLSKEASKFVTVVLGGEGADEIFAGYSYYDAFTNNNSLRSIVDKLFKRSIGYIDENKHETASGFPVISSMSDRHKIISNFDKIINSDDVKELYNGIEIELNNIGDPLKRAQVGDIKGWLTDDLLIKYDRMAMASSLEGRAPYLDSTLATYALNLPIHFKWNHGKSKYILREAFKDVIPKKIIKRKKQGFNLPMSDWIKGKLKDEFMESTQLKQNDFINNDYYLQILENHIKGKEERARLLYSIFVYRLWFKNLISQ